MGISFIQQQKIFNTNPIKILQHFLFFLGEKYYIRKVGVQFSLRSSPTTSQKERWERIFGSIGHH